MLLYIRNIIFYIFLVFWTIFSGIVCGPLLLTFRRTNIALMGVVWGNGIYYGLRYICGIKTKIIGLKNIPKHPFIIASKHQSAWETVFFLKQFRDPVFILKKELCRIPFYGWYLSPMGMICIDRKAGVSSIKQTEEGVKRAFQEKRPVAIFPEGTRVKPQETTAYKSGIYAIHSACPSAAILPVALNSGLVWSKESWLIKPGLVTVKFLPALKGEFKKRELLDKLASLINPESDKL